MNVLATGAHSGESSIAAPLIGLLDALEFKTGNISLDKDRRGYDFTKAAIYDERLQMPMHKVCNEELVGLEDIHEKNKAKIDHPPRGSKDCSDALAGVVLGLTTRREIYFKHGISMSRIPDSVQQILARNQEMRYEEDVAVEKTSNLIIEKTHEPMH